MKNNNTITGLKLEGFQVFEKPTYIPLDELTLIFGPNSAGKSAVQDALEFYKVLHTLKVSDRYGVKDNKLRELLKRHWRKTSKKNNRTNKMSISVFHTTDCFVHRSVASQINLNESDSFIEFIHPVNFENRWTFTYIQDEDGDENLEFINQNELLAFHHDFEFFVNSEFFISYKKVDLEVNLNNLFFKNYEMKVDFYKVAKENPDQTSLVDGCFTVYGVVFPFPAYGDVQGKKKQWLEFELTDESSNKELLRSALEELSLVIGSFLFTANGNSDFTLDTVTASRMVPTKNQLTFRLGNIDDTWEKILAAPSTIFRASALREPVNLGDSLRHILPQGDSRYIELAESLSYETIHEEKNSHSEYSNKINRALCDHLFLERGYRVDFDMRAVISKADYQAVRKGNYLYLEDCGFLVELFLRDAQGRKHDFEDVGSGIGYVLPVLCSIFNQQLSFIQQPELHIHPALQAALGDVFIEAINANKKIIIETHSEHLLLRILKRIRQTHLQVDIADDLKIKANDVCVLYFDPLFDGSTSVKRLRITEDGEFMDRWPRGFFGERDQELFDE